MLTIALAVPSHAALPGVVRSSESETLLSRKMLGRLQAIPFFASMQHAHRVTSNAEGKCAHLMTTFPGCVNEEEPPFGARASIEFHVCSREEVCAADEMMRIPFVLVV